MNKTFFIFGVFVILLFSGCNSEEEAKVVSTNSDTNFEKLKALSSKTYKLKTFDEKLLPIKIENDILSSKDLKDKIVLINFWATWCPPCIEEIPIFNELYEKYSDKFVIVGVLFEKDKDPKELEDFIKKYNIKFPITVGDENFRMAKTFNDVRKVPESYLYSKDGKYVKDYIGKVDEVDLENYLKNK